MNGNTPYAGVPGKTQAGHRAETDVPDLSPEQKESLRDSITAIASQTREFLPDEYVVGSKVADDGSGPQAQVSVQPPVGHPVSAGFQPDLEDFDGDDLVTHEETEVARGLAASAAMQVKQMMGDNITPTAR
ncbi:DUF5811 family protein [Halorussus gelatinilyticus]|uniref:DUF5811 family protein n=1 Tax=Halorussus gelatinilyticus TaxID=2937524 RepID=A0A8U0IMS8_9EURY|nr:DUF5811 family protein [Halorussus gelatinilyticus]UPW01329.1 DUF5811 family protein [Halorussus gelatinilyticus]